MKKLLANVLEVSAAELFDLPDASACQCCGTPFDVPNMLPDTPAPLQREGIVQWTMRSTYAAHAADGAHLVYP